MPVATTSEQVTQELPWLRRLARRLAADEADDLVQDTLLLAHRDQPRAHDSGRGLRPWLAHAMRNRFRSMQRSRIARVQREHSVAPDRSGDAPDQLALETDVIRIVDEALRTLSDDERTLLRDRFFDGHSAAEIARERGVPSATIRTRLRRALDKLRTTLDQRHGNERARWAPAMLAVPVAQTPSKWIVGGSMAMATKGMVGAGALAGLAAIAWIAVNDDPAAARTATTASDESATKPIPAARMPKRRAGERATAEQLAVARTQWQAKRDAIDDARQRRGATASPTPAPPTEVEPPEDMLAQMADLACLDLMPDHPKGELALQVHYVGEPGVGTIVESIEVVKDTLGAPELRECWTESMYMLQYDAPKAPVRGMHEFAYNAGDGEAVQQLLPLLKTFLADHPELVAAHPELASSLELPDDAPMRDWMNADFMRLMSTEPELNKQLNEYFTEHLADDGSPD